MLPPFDLFFYNCQIEEAESFIFLGRSLNVPVEIPKPAEVQLFPGTGRRLAEEEAPKKKPEINRDQLRERMANAALQRSIAKPEPK